MSNNGRVILPQGFQAKPYERVYESNDANRPAKQSYVNEAVKGIHDHSEVGKVFFSDANISALQQGIRYMVYTKSCNKHIIDNQSPDELKVVMRSIYLQNAKNQPFNILEQVRDLNAMVLEFCVERILNEINIYIKYRQDITAPPSYIDRGVSTNVQGTKVLELTKF